jgi:hypothetical protein
MAKYIFFALILLTLGCNIDRELIEDDLTTMKVIKYTTCYRGARVLCNIHLYSSRHKTEHVLWAREWSDTLIFPINKTWSQTEPK